MRTASSSVRTAAGSGAGSAAGAAPGEAPGAAGVAGRSEGRAFATRTGPIAQPFETAEPRKAICSVGTIVPVRAAIAAAAAAPCSARRSAPAFWIASAIAETLRRAAEISSARNGWPVRR